MTQETDKSMGKTVNRQQRHGISLRARITIAITAIAVFIAVVIGFFTNERSRTTQTYLGSQFQEAVKEKSEFQIQTRVQQEAQSINQIFVNASRSVTSVAGVASHLISQEGTFSNDSLYWNATQKLTRLPNGAWDNPSSDIASVFAPAYLSIDKPQIDELNALVRLDSIVPNTLLINPDIVGLYYISSGNITIYYPNIDLASLVPPNFTATDQTFYTDALHLPPRGYIWSPPYQDPAQTGLIVTLSSPVYDNASKIRGVIGADIQLAKVKEQVLSVKVGETGYAFLIDEDGHILAMPEAGYADFNLTPEDIRVNEVPKVSLVEQGPPSLKPFFQDMALGGTSIQTVQFHDTEYYLVYTRITSTRYSLGIFVPVSEMNTAVLEAQTLVTQENQATRSYILILLGVVIGAGALISFALSQVLTNPLVQLTNTAEKISAGDLTAEANPTSVREVSVLTHAFNAMTAQLRHTLVNLEQLVAERTSELQEAKEHSQHRAEQFEAISQVARNISTSQDLETLLPRITAVISKHFGFYHVGVFLIDSHHEYAVLRAANSPGGKRMLERNHKLKIGETSIVGYVTSQNRPRIALDTGIDAVYFDNPDLPETRSEMALPLRTGEEVIGALDVQSVEPNAFSDENIETLSTLADQVSIAIQNARLYEETRNALAQSQAVYREFVQTGWRQFTHTLKLTGIRRNNANVTLLKGETAAADVNGKDTLNLPIKLRNQKIGTLKLHTEDDKQWTQDEIDIATAILDRAALAMESARLLDQAQRRAARERVISDISSNIGVSSDIEAILRTAVQELGRTMGGAEVVLELGSDVTAGEVDNE